MKKVLMILMLTLVLIVGTTGGVLANGSDNGDIIIMFDPGDPGW